MENKTLNKNFVRLLISVILGSLFLKVLFEYCFPEEPLSFGFHQIDRELFNSIQKSEISEFQVIKLNSNGGKPSISLMIAEILEEKKVSLVIDSECSSACSEIILASGNNIVFHNSPIVGFHWGPQMNKHLLERSAGHDLEQCSWENVVAIEKLYARKGLNANFWRETLTKLKLTNYAVDYKEAECPWHSKTFENHIWLPSSEQLRNNLKLSFLGSVCADNYDQCTRRADKRWKKGTRIVIGDEVYVSKGR